MKVGTGDWHQQNANKISVFASKGQHNEIERLVVEIYNEGQRSVVDTVRVAVTRALHNACDHFTS